MMQCRSKKKEVIHILAKNKTKILEKWEIFGRAEGGSSFHTFLALLHLK